MIRAISARILRQILLVIIVGVDVRSSHRTTPSVSGNRTTAFGRAFRYPACPQLLRIVQLANCVRWETRPMIRTKPISAAGPRHHGKKYLPRSL